jgi:hypothetical protein
VEAVEETGRHEIVYNMTVRDSHTFFVGKPEWDFALWVHNQNCNSRQLGKSLTDNVRPRLPGEQAAHIVPAGNWANTNRSQIVKDAIAKSQAKINELLPQGINGYYNGFWAKSGHMGTHTDAYFKKMWDLLQTAKTENDVVSLLSQLRKMAESGFFI